jgi:hypothetical protein
MKLADFPINPLEFPAKLEASGTASYNVEHKKLTLDSKIYALCTNKIEDVGVMRKRKFNIICDGQGHMNLQELISNDEKIRRLAKLFEDGHISKSEFDETKKKILDEF